MSSDRTLGERLNSLMVHFGRALRRGDRVGADLATEHKSVLAVVVFGGPIRMKDLALRERLSPPSITRTVGILERRGLVRKRTDPKDGRAQLIIATRQGRRMVLRGRDDRACRLDESLARLAHPSVRRLEAAIGDLEALTELLSGERADPQGETSKLDV